jgi:heme exporter protein D
MEATNHFGFIVAAYAAAAVTIGVLIAWVMLDYRAQRRALAELEMQGFTRRSAPARSERVMEQAKEEV